MDVKHKSYVTCIEISKNKGAGRLETHVCTYTTHVNSKRPYEEVNIIRE